MLCGHLFESGAQSLAAGEGRIDRYHLLYLRCLFYVILRYLTQTSPVFPMFDLRRPLHFCMYTILGRKLMLQ